MVDRTPPRRPARAARRASLEPEAALLHDGVIFVCAAGVRSQTAARLAEQLGFNVLYSLTGGTRSWVSAGLPLVQD